MAKTWQLAQVPLNFIFLKQSEMFSYLCPFFPQRHDLLINRCYE